MCQNIDADRKVLADQSVRISNDLYGSDIAAAIELTKDYTRPIDGRLRFCLSDLVRDGYEDTAAAQKLNKFLEAKPVVTSSVSLGDFVQAFQKMSEDKRGKRSSPRLALQMD